MKKNNTIETFLALVRAGLWEEDVNILSYGSIDYNVICQLAEEQSVEGLIAAGLEHVKDVKIPQEVSLFFVGSALQLEQRNKQMNEFLGRLIEKMRNANIYALVVKGQGIAQCYERPLWRSCGDIDLLLSEENYNNAKSFLKPFASIVDKENPLTHHLGMTIENWKVELHGSLCNRLWKSVNNGIYEAHNSVIFEGKVRSWINDKTQIFLPNADEDVIFVFTHILQHFYHEGIGLRQICDWCRLLWTFFDKLQLKLLEGRLRKMGLMSEWKAFSVLAVDKLGMPQDKMPFYSPSKVWKKRADNILSFILEVGNFGHNRDFSYYTKKSYFARKVISFKRHVNDLAKQFCIFPVDSIRVWNGMLREGIIEMIKGR